MKAAGSGRREEKWEDQFARETDATFKMRGTHPCLYIDEVLLLPFPLHCFPVRFEPPM
jgi:hypothetical protein